MPAHIAESPAKKQSKWSADEDTLIIDLRGSGMKWEDISKNLPGRSAISCRLHYQNYLERRAEWDEEKKNKLARLYERFKPEMWAKVAEEMGTPWRAAEAMHWQLGESDMARRAGVNPFSLSSAPIDAPPPRHQNHRPSPTRGHAHSHSHPSVPTMNTISGGSTSTSRFQRVSHQGTNSSTSSRSLAARRDSTPRSIPSPSPSEGIMLAGIGGGQTGRNAQLLPSVAELTTGVSPYSTLAYSVAAGTGGGYVSSGPQMPPPAIGYGQRPVTAPGEKRRGSPQMLPRETSRRKQKP